MTTKTNEAYFVGEYRFRSLNGFAAMIVIAAFSSAFLWFAIGAPVPNESFVKYIRIVFAVVGTVGLLIAAYVGFGILADRMDKIIIGTDGIRNGRSFYPWTDVASFHAEKFSNGIFMIVMTGRGNVRRRRLISTTPGISAEKFELLARRLMIELSQSHPHVKIDPEIRPPAD